MEYEGLVQYRGAVQFGQPFPLEWVGDDMAAEQFSSRGSDPFTQSPL